MEWTDRAGISLEIRLLGKFAVLSNGEHIGLSTSRKTRALLAYLAAVDCPQQREHLCEMFWDDADDPDKALYWSLWKIRQLVNIKGTSVLITERSTVALCTQLITVDLCRIKSAMPTLASLETSELEKVACLFNGRFLDDLSLPRCPEFEAWRISGINEVHAFRARILRVLIGRLEVNTPLALRYKHALDEMH